MEKRFTTTFEPIDRLVFGDTLFDSVAIGHFTAVLRDPTLKDLAHGEWPTLPAEGLLNFGPFGPFPCMFLLGCAVGLISRVPRRGQASLIVFALYPYTMVMLIAAILLGSTKIINVVLYALPLLLVGFFLEKRIYRIEWLTHDDVYYGQHYWTLGNPQADSQALQLQGRQPHT